MLINITKKLDVFLIGRNNDEFSFSANGHSFFIKLIQNFYYLKVLNNNVTKYSLRFKLKEEVFDFIMETLDEIKFEDAKDKIQEEIFHNISDFELFNGTASTRIIDSEILYNPNKKDSLPIGTISTDRYNEIDDIENINKINDKVYILKFKGCKYLKIGRISDKELICSAFLIGKKDKIYKINGGIMVSISGADSGIKYMTEDGEYHSEGLTYTKGLNEVMIKKWGTVVKSKHKNGEVTYILYLYNNKKKYFSRVWVKDFVEVSEGNFIIDGFKITIQEIENFIDNKRNTELFFIEKGKLVYNDL